MKLKSAPLIFCKYLTILLLVVVFTACSQSNISQPEKSTNNLQYLLAGKSDSEILLLDAAELPLTDGEKISLLIQQGGTAIFSRQFAIAEKRFGQALQLAENHSNSTKAAVLRSMASLQRIQGNMHAALHYYCLAYTTLDEDIPSELRGFIYQGKGIIFAVWGEMDAAIYYARKSIDAAAAAGNRTAEAVGLMNLSMVLYDFGEYPFAEATTRKGIAILEEIGSRHNLWLAYSNLASALAKQNRLEEAVRYAEKSAAIAGALGQPNIAQHSIYNRRGELYLERGDYANSIIMFSNALTLRSKMFEHQLIASSKNAMSIAYARLGNYDRAYTLAIEALEITKRENIPFFQMDIYRNLASIYAARGDIQQFWTMSDRSVALRDSVFTMQRITAIQELQIRYETEQKTLLLARKAEAIQHKQTQRLLISIIFIALFILFVVVVLTQRYRVKNMTRIVQQYEAFSEYKKEMRKKDKTTKQSSDAIDKLLNKLKHLLEVEKIYHQPGLTINAAAEMLGTNRTYLSEAIVRDGQKSFTDYLNSYRIEEAREMIKEQEKSGKYANYTIEAIAEMVGFNARSTFYAAFKQTVGVTPNEYKKIISQT